MAGLDNIKGFDEGGTTTQTPGAQISLKGATVKGQPSIQGGIALDPTQTNEILQNMQRFIEERESPLNKLVGGLKDAYATTYGPSAMIARDREKALQDKEVMDYRTQMASYQAAQAAAQRDADWLSKAMPGAGGKGTVSGGAGLVSVGGVNITPEAAARVGNARNATEARNIIDEDLKNQSVARGKGQFEAAGNKPETYFVPGKGYVQMTPNMFLNMPADLKKQVEEETFKRLGFIPGGSTSAAATPGATGAKAVAMPKAEVPLEGLPTPFYAQESSSGKADTSKPGIQGAQGPMQVTKETFDTYKAKGVIPKEYDLNDPGHAYASGVLILNDLHKKHGQDINKISAEYFGGPGAINADGTINVDRKDASGKTVGSYINDIRGRMKLPAVDLAVTPATTTGTAPTTTAAAATVSKAPPPVGAAPIISSAAGIPTFSEPAPNAASFGSPEEYNVAKADWEKRRDASLEIFKKFQEQSGGESAKAFADAEKNFVTLTDQKKLGARQVTTNQLDGWLQQWGDNPRVLEILSKPTFANAVADALQQGVTLASAGTLSIPGIERIIQSSMPGLKGEEVTALKQLSSIMGPRILQIVEQSKGSSSDKDWAAFTQIAGNSSSGYDFLHKALNYDKASLKADKADRNLYNSMIKPNQPTDFRGFSANPERDKIYDEYSKETARISGTKYEKQKLPPKPAGMPTNVPAQWSNTTQSYWIGNKEYKVK